VRGIWRSMKRRCENSADKAYSSYGGRGITVCDRWRSSFEAFVSDLGLPPDPSLTLERVDGDRGYEPGNVVWASRKVQQNNLRTNFRTTGGETLAQLSARSGVNRYTLRQRIVRGMSPEEAASKPIPARKQPTRLTAEDVLLLKQLIAEGWTTRAVAKRIGCDPSRVSRVANRSARGSEL
jgi:lambda repressor-like predicted transcriptional regulator